MKCKILYIDFTNKIRQIENISINMNEQIIPRANIVKYFGFISDTKLYNKEKKRRIKNRNCKHGKSLS